MRNFPLRNDSPYEPNAACCSLDILEHSEGTSRMSQTDFARFIEIATGSVFEVVSQSFIVTSKDS